MNEILFEILLCVVIVCVTLFTSVIVPYFKEQIKGTKYEELLNEIEMAVRYAEQTITGLKMGKAKKAEVLAYMQNWLAEKGIHITEQQLDILIEATVFSMNNEG